MQNIIFTDLANMGNKTEITRRDCQPFPTEVWPRQSPQEMKDVKQNTKRKPKRIRHAYTTDQLEILEKAYSGYKFINKKNRKAMSQALNINERCIKNWFQNRRMKEKKESLKNDKNPPNDPSLPRYEIKICSLNQRTEVDNGNDIQICVPSKITNSTCANDDESTNTWDHFNQSPVLSSPHFQSRKEQTNCRSASNAVSTSLLPKTPSSNLSNESDVIAIEDINELLTDLSQFIQTNSICYSSSQNQLQKSYESSSSSFTSSLHPSSQYEIGISNLNSYSSSDVIATEDVNDPSVNFSQIIHSDNFYDNYPITPCEEEKRCELGTSSLSAVFDNETERCNVHANSASNSILIQNVSHLNLSQENQSDLVYYNPYHYENYAHNFYDDHYTYSIRS